MNKIIPRKCICGYEYKSEEDQEFIPITFELSSMRLGNEFRPNAYACPKCKMIQMA
jgi:hypothetical protein